MSAPQRAVLKIMNSFKRSSQSGISLIEIAIVLVILGLVIGGTLVPISTQYENSRRSETSGLLNKVLEATYGYAMVNGNLPCPDISGDGLENRVGANCSAPVGGLPWVTIAVGQNDAWSQPLGYRVTATFADTTNGTGCGVATPGVSFELCSTGDMTVLDASGGNLVAQNIPAVILSRGKNWAVPPSPDETENSDGDAVFVSKIFSGVVGAEFDDLIVWVTPAILKTRMVNAGRLP